MNNSLLETVVCTCTALSECVAVFRRLYAVTYTS